MTAIGWLSKYLSTPLTDRGFYSEKWSEDETLPVGTAFIRYFISFDKYVELLTIEHNFLF